MGGDEAITEENRMQKSRNAGDTVKQAVQILGREAGVHPQIMGEALDVAAYLTALIETKSDEISGEDLDQFNAAFGQFLEQEADGELEPVAVFLGLWLQLRSVGRTNKAEASGREPDRMFA